MIKRVMEDYKVLLRSIPAATVSLFFVSVIMMNLLANKELISVSGTRLRLCGELGFVFVPGHDLQALWRQGIHQNLYPRAAGQPGREPVLLGMLAHARHVGRLLRHGHDRGQHRP